MKIIFVCVVFCAAAVLVTADKAANQQHVQLSPSNVAPTPNNVKPNQAPAATAPAQTGPIPSNLVDAKRIVDQVTTHIPRIFTWRSWNHWLDSNVNNLKKSFDVLTGTGMAFADKSFALTFKSGHDAADATKPLTTSSWTAPTGRCPASLNCQYRGILIFDADSRPVAVLQWQAADKVFVRTYNNNVWTPVEADKFNNWYRFVQKSLDQNAPKLNLPVSALAPDQQQRLTSTTARPRSG